MKALVLVALLALGACASPEPAYFTLAPVPGPAIASGPRLVEMRRPGLAGYLDRPEIVRASSAYQLRLLGGERWAEPFGDMVSRVLIEDLNQRLPGTSVFSATGAISADASANLEVDVQRFDSDASGLVRLVAQVAIARGRNRPPVSTRAIQLTQMPTGRSTGELAAAMSALLGQMSDQIATMLRSF
ncbi:MAG TPA: PqiC family protein [Acetobacteraceae bacterium]